MYVDCAGSMEEDMEFVSKNQMGPSGGPIQKKFL
jgi:hypothetical protein